MVVMQSRFGQIASSWQSEVQNGGDGGGGGGSMISQAPVIYA